MDTRPSPSPTRSSEQGAEAWRSQALDSTKTTPGEMDRSEHAAPAAKVPGKVLFPQSPSSAPPRETLPQPGDREATPGDVATALSFGLELVRYGAMLIAAEGRLHLANRMALAILDRQDGLVLSRSGLVANRASDTNLLLKLLHEAIQSPEQGEPRDSPVILPRKAAATSLILRVVPGPGLDRWPGTGNRAALLMMYDQDMGLNINVTLLSKLYGLTRGEAALAATLIRGKSIEEAAQELFISPHTARTHLKRIFMKTDTHRQTELVVRIFPAVL